MAGHRHHYRNRCPRLGFLVCDVQLVACKIHLKQLSSLRFIMVTEVVCILVVSYGLLELSVSVSVWVLLFVHLV